MVSRSLACGFEINGNVCARECVWGLRGSPPRVGVEFECVLALAYELRRAGEGPPFGGRDEGHHGVHNNRRQGSWSGLALSTHI